LRVYTPLTDSEGDTILPLSSVSWDIRLEFRVSDK